MEELAQEARSFDSKPKALSKGLGLGGGGVAQVERRKARRNTIFLLFQT